MTDIKVTIRNFGYGISDELVLSPFEYHYLLASRSSLWEAYSALDEEDKVNLKEYDKALLDRAEEYHDYLQPIFIWNKSAEPITQWWWHLDKVLSGQLKVDVDNNQIEYDRQVYIIN
ncbi:hypothetical protein PAECIP111893_01298 [Paenibacillus plantiphilus]|uniref:Uncharacterized protein n=1 Tax=Paenibacillus plantiphilus TaxID=2905650 RepID=A0ABN8G8I6_9BACL|nr:hypothetical protein [Paenibacillus plantiphilus]CAH1199293.1 hypothetical protein PAECIP111893_01298 [Paenibacillus plantiphilus]